MIAPAKRLARRVITPVIETVFPSKCWATGAPIEAADFGLSPESREAISRSIVFPYCAACGMTTGPYTRSDRKRPCMHCEKRLIGVETVARVGTFDPPLAELVKTLKFRKRWEIAAIMAPFMVQAIELQIQARGVKVDALVPVALHWRRRFSRGFNQAEEISRAMAKVTGWKVTNALRRVRPTHEQSLTQSVTQRRENLDKAFVARGGVSVAEQHIWLIDDVCTTGATLHSAALAFKRLPKEERPARIHAAVVCVTDKTPVPLTPW